MPDREDPLVSGWFAVDFQGAITGAFKDCDGLVSETDVQETFQSDAKGVRVVYKQPGNPKIHNVILRRGVTKNVDMWKWRKQVEDGKVNEARKNGSITLYTQDGTEIVRFNFKNAWPCRLTAPSVNAGDNEITVEELEITHEGMTRAGGDEG
jgi:phage tail-like protein